jgi:FkbM family methyltransferase
MAVGVWVYGAGNYGLKIASLLKRHGLPLLGFIDKRADDLREFGGAPVVSPSAFTPSMACDKCLAIGVLNPALDADDILPFAANLPFRERLWNADLPEALGEDANTMWLSSRTFLQENFTEIRDVAEALDDEGSFDVYLALLINRVTGRRSDHPRHDWRTQYIPPDLPGFDRPIVFVDGGAFTGDTGLMLQATRVELKSWIAFEPDAQNFDKLAVTAREALVPTTIFPCGLSDRLHQVRFEADLGLGSRVTDNEQATLIQCVALDDVIANIVPDFIKLDVEGAEIAALNGMARTIGKHRPRLAISGYHKPQDLWEVPLKQLELLSNCSLHVRQHGGNGFETVFYAVPRS